MTFEEKIRINVFFPLRITIEIRGINGIILSKVKLLSFRNPNLYPHFASSIFVSTRRTQIMVLDKTKDKPRFS